MGSAHKTPSPTIRTPMVLGNVRIAENLLYPVYPQLPHTKRAE